MSKKESDLPEDDLIRKFQEDARARLTDNRVLQASAGDREAIRSLMVSYILNIQNDHYRSKDSRWFRMHSDIGEWIEQAFVKILNGESADSAFALTGKSRGRPGKSFREREEDFELANEMFSLVEECGGKITKAADVYHQLHQEISASKAEKTYRAWYKNWPYAPHLGKK